MRNLVMSAMWDGRFEMAQPFVASLIKSGYRGDVVMFVENVPAEDVQKLKAYGVNVIQMRPFDRTQQSGNGLRYTYFWEYIDRTPGYGNVMVSDVRDVVFQMNPLDQSMRDELWLFLEDAKIGENDWNSGWIHALYGEEALKPLKDKPISCSGVTMGHFPRMYDYLLLMARYLQENTVKLGGIDQGVHNFLLYNNLLGGSRVFATGNGPVLTLGLMGERFNFVAKDVQFVNDDGSLPAVVHQYDRANVAGMIRSHYQLPKLETIT